MDTIATPRKDIFSFIKEEEAAYELPITVIDGWEWNMKKHIRLSKLYKHSQFSQGNDDKARDDKPFRNIVRPILNVQYRTEGFDVKDVVLYIDNEDQYFKSFLVKKYHDRWAEKHHLDEFIDKVNEERTDYGASLVRDVDKEAPEVIPLDKIAFCDQTNILSGPLGLKHFFSPDELQGFASVGWGDTKKGATCTIQEAINLAKSEKIPDAQDGKSNRTPGKYIECYEVNGVMPEDWLKADGDPDKYVRQMQILMFYTDTEGKKQGLKLYAGRQAEGTFKVIQRGSGIYGRALDWGGVEELFDAQVWANYDEIIMKGMLDAASKIIIKTTDPAMKQKHPTGLKDLDNLSIVEVEDGKDAGVMDTTPRNYAMFERKVAEWEEHARTMGSANEAVLGQSPSSGTPFKLQNLVTQQGLGLHEYRRGKLATAIFYVYTDWILQHIKVDLNKGAKFLETLSMKELQTIADSFVQYEANQIIKKKILAGEEITPAMVDKAKADIRMSFMKRGNKHFLQIFENEMADVPIAVRVSVDGKQKDFDKITDKLVNIIRQIIAAPQILDDPRMADLFNQIIEFSGFSPIDFGMPVAKVAPQIQPPAQVIPATPVIPTPAPAFGG